MGLLDDLPYGLLNLIRNAAQNQNPNASSGAGDANDLALRLPRQPQRLPLSFAGPDLTTDITASSPGRPGTTNSLPGPADALANVNRSWSRGDRSADFLRAQPPAPPAQTLTAQALRMKGVPESDITAATGNPEMIKQLIMQNYSPVSALAPVRTGYKPYASRANGGFFADTRGTARLDDAATLDDAPLWREPNPASQTSPTGLVKEHADSHHEQCIAKCSDLALPTGDFGIQLQRCVLACLSGGNSGFPDWDRHFP
jgi:hypothetical protein